VLNAKRIPERMMNPRKGTRPKSNQIILQTHFTPTFTIRRVF